MLKLSFNQTQSELMVRAAATVVFSALRRTGVPEHFLSEAADRPQYGFTASAASEPVGPKLVRITDLQDGKIEWGSVPYCECPDLDSYLLRENDLLFARTGATTGKTHLVAASPEQAVFASYLIRLRAKPGILPAYLYAFFQSDDYWAQIMEEKEGSAQPNVNGEKLSNVRVPMVDPTIQGAIARFISAIRARTDGGECPLPDLPLFLAPQKSVVLKLENVIYRVQQVQSLRRDSIEMMDALVASRRNALFGDRPAPNWVKLSTYVSEIENGKSPQCESRPANADEWGVLTGCGKRGIGIQGQMPVEDGSVRFSCPGGVWKA